MQVQDQAAFREQQAGFIDQLLALVTALLLMAILIALFGIVNTLGLSIYERTPRARPAPRGRHEPAPGQAHDPMGVGHHRRVRRGARASRSASAFGWALQQALKTEGVSELAVPVGQLVIYLVWRASRACWRRSGRRGERRSSTCSRRSPTSSAAGIGRLSCPDADPDPARRLHDRASRRGAGRRGPAEGPIAARVDGELRDLSFVPAADADVEPVDAGIRRRAARAAALDRARARAGGVRSVPRHASTRSARR